MRCLFPSRITLSEITRHITFPQIWMKPYLLHRRNLTQLGCFDSLNQLSWFYCLSQLFGFDSLHQLCWLGRHCSPWFQPRRRLVRHCKVWQKEPGGTDIPATKDTLHCKQDLIYIFPEMKLLGLVPNFHIRVSVRFIIAHDWPTHRLNMEVLYISKVYLGSMSREVHSCTHWLRPRNSHPPPAFGLVLRGRYHGQQR